MDYRGSPFLSKETLNRFEIKVTINMWGGPRGLLDCTHGGHVPFTIMNHLPLSFRVNPATMSNEKFFGLIFSSLRDITISLIYYKLRSLNRKHYFLQGHLYKNNPSPQFMSPLIAFFISVLKKNPFCFIKISITIKNNDV